MELWGKWFSLLGVAFMLLGVAWIYLRMGRRESKRFLDERQKQAEATSMKLGFIVAIVYSFAIWIIISLSEPELDTVRTLMLAGIMLSGLAVYTCMLLTGAVLPLSKMPILMIASQFLMAGAQLYSAFRTAKLQAIFEIDTVPWDNLILSVSFFAMGVIHLVSWLLSRRTDE